MTDAPKKKPAIKMSAGALKVAVWANEHEGKTFHSVNLTRSYKDRNDQWQETESLGEHDLLPAAELLRAVWSRIRLKDAEATRPAAPSEAAAYA